MYAANRSSKVTSSPLACPGKDAFYGEGNCVYLEAKEYNIGEGAIKMLFKQAHIFENKTSWNSPEARSEKILMSHATY